MCWIEVQASRNKVRPYFPNLVFPASYRLVYTPISEVLAPLANHVSLILISDKD